MSIQHEQLRIIKSKKQRSNVIFSCKKIKNQKKWTREEDELLIVLAEKYNEKHWKEISRRFVKKNSLQCFSRYKRIRPGIIKGSWKKEEDFRIIDLVHKYGKAWSKISKILGTRNGKQIRDRFINVLDPEIRKGKFTDEEDRKLILLFKQNGPKWATIAKFYPNRTADMIKNRFHSSIKKKLVGDNTEKFYNLKECKEELSNCKNDYSTDESTKSFNLENGHSGNFSIQNAYVNSQIASPCDMIMNEADIYDNRNFNSTITSRVCDSDLYSSNNINYDIQYESKTEETFNSSNSFVWNFEDYFTI